MIQPKFSSVSPTDLKPNPWNTNVVSPEMEERIRASIKRNGIFKPIIVREIANSGITELEIIGGEHRWEQAQALGLTEVPIVNLGPISDAQAKEIGVIDNARYGHDDTLGLAELLSSIGSKDELQTFLPYGDTEFDALFAASDIALDELGIDENFEKTPEPEEPPAARAPKTHTVMRFKVGLADAERVTALIAKTQRIQGLTSSDELTNAGDALVHLLMGQFTAPETKSGEIELDDISFEDVK